MKFLTEKELKEIQEALNDMTPEELRSFRNHLDADSMGDEGEEDKDED